MGILTWIAIGILAFLVLSSFFKDQVSNLPYVQNLPFIGNQTDQSSGLPDSVQKGIDFMEQSYGLPLWVWALIILVILKLRK